MGTPFLAVNVQAGEGYEARGKTFLLVTPCLSPVPRLNIGIAADAFMNNAGKEPKEVAEPAIVAGDRGIADP
jgi:hypothetical protein